MPTLLRKFLGLILLISTVGLATCQSMFNGKPVNISDKIDFTAK